MTAIRICGIQYDIQCKEASTMGGHIGLANFNTQEIWIGDSFTNQTQHIARAHEVLHIMSDAYNLKLSEEQIKYLAHGLTAFFEDNPGQIIFAPINRDQ